MIAVSGLALGAGQRVFVLSLRVQENREIFADRPEALCQHGFRSSTDDHVIVIGVGSAEQFVTDGTADEVCLHGREYSQRPAWKRKLSSLPFGVLSAM